MTDRTVKPLGMKTGKPEKLAAKIPKAELRLRILGPFGKPLANKTCRLLWGGRVRFNKKTDAGGNLTLRLPEKLKVAALLAGGMTWELRIEELDPEADKPSKGTSGIQARLSNLGFEPGKVNGVMSPETAAAIRAFERAQSLKETGKAEGDTLRKLVEVHGC